ncbi:hypothetical protein ACP86_21840 [Marinobacter sp. CP1]|uniref:PEP-CTERM sorting domain-containing protein n=1 Tax=unclassified Marinobacter TaxID=83889 RepID=UPI00069F95C8|nr:MULTISPECIES: PEP-CTERM sorting domain-containing protein [unclassified Marinobacter]AKV98547.1 hypothetical protein ACP86_21840 [Marinobacter sp. CP1]
MKFKTATISVFLGTALFCGTASAGLVEATDVNTTTGIGGDLTFTPTGGDLGLKNVNGVDALGVKGGPSGAEIDIQGDQAIAVQKTSREAFQLASTTLAFLYDGPEFNDFQERASIEAFFANGGSSTAVIENIYNSPSDLDFNIYIDNVLLDSTQTNALILSDTTASTNGTPGLVQLGALFGSQLIQSLSFTALEGSCGVDSCNNQSDYSIKNIATVPEPGTLALFALGLTGLVVAKRKSA